jgi:Astacin (Peptidase family M12A)
MEWDVAHIRALAGARWHNAIIPYDFDDSIELSDPIRLTVFKAAVDFWHQRTPVRFVLRTTEPDYLLVKRVPSKERCSTFVGRKGGEQVLECAGTPEIARVAHELGHAIGLFHEQQRLDRDAMVGVSAAAIRDEARNYARLDNELMVGPYDFGSLMHYSVNVGATDRLPLTKIHPDPTLPPVYATATSPSAGDLAAVQFMYGVVPDRTPIAALTKNDDHMELWVVDENGAVRGAPFHDGAWHTWYWLFGRQFPQRAHLAALHRRDEHMEIWGVGVDGLLHGVWFDGAKWQPWYTLGGRAFPPRCHLSVLGRDSHHMELWAVGTDDVLHGVHFVDSWQPWYSLPGRRLVAGGGVACVSRGGDHMEVWSIGADDRLHGVWWNGHAWQPWYTLAGTSFPPGAPVVALTRDSDFMEIWAVDDAQHLRGVYFDGGWHPWYLLGGLDLPSTTPLAALSRSHEHMEVWGVGPANPTPTAIGQRGVHGVWFDGNWHPYYRVI